MTSEVSRDERDLGKLVFEGFIKCVHPRRPKLAPLFSTLLSFWVTYIRSPLLTKRHNGYHSAAEYWTETGGGHQMWWCIKHIKLMLYHRLVFYIPTAELAASVYAGYLFPKHNTKIENIASERTQRPPEVTGDVCWSTLAQLCKFKTLEALRVKSLKRPESISDILRQKKRISSQHTKLEKEVFSIFRKLFKNQTAII